MEGVTGAWLRYIGKVPVPGHAPARQSESLEHGWGSVGRSRHPVMTRVGMTGVVSGRSRHLVMLQLVEHEERGTKGNCIASEVGPGGPSRGV